MNMNVMGSPGRIGSIAGSATELVPGTAEIRERLMATTTLGLRLGGKYPTVKNDVEALVSRIQAQTEKANRIAGDRTRNQYQKHLFARDLANDISAEIMRTKGVLSRKSKELIAEGGDLVEDTLGPRDNYAALYSEIRSWVRENKTCPPQQSTEALRECLEAGTSKMGSATPPQTVQAPSQWRHRTYASRFRRCSRTRLLLPVSDSG